MPGCPSCGRESAKGFRFCPHCGTPLGADAAPREQRKTVTVLFCDVVGSTTLGESSDPETLRSVLARYFARMKTIVERHGGTVEKFIGDAVMAVFGVPVVHEDDALRALRAAAEMRNALPELGVQARMGLDTGEVVTGTRERLATGDAVNVAARLEQAAKPGEILIGAETYALARDAVTVEALPPLDLKGKQQPVAAFRLVSVDADAPAIARRTDAAMVGRERERRLLGDAWERACSERACCLFTVLGTAGVGKSRLVTEFLSSVGDATVLRARCLSYGDGITYWPVVELLIQLVGKEPDTEFVRYGLDQRAADALRAVLGGDGFASTEETAWAVRKLLEAAARERPIVAVLDDLHWAEPTLLDLVEHVADLARGAPMLLLCMARPDLLDRRPGWSGGKLNATTLLLEPLSAEETDHLLGDLLAGTAIGESLRERVRATAEGNPLFVEEMVAMLRDARSAQDVVPPTIQALLAARLDQLEAEERTVLERAAVEGRIFHRGAVLALTPAGTRVDAELAKLVRKELVRPDTPQFPAEDAFRFRHLLIRDAAYDSLPKTARTELHEQFARWLEERAPDLVEHDEIVGYHLERAHRYRAELGPLDERGRELGRRAGELLARSGTRALERGDGPAAANLLARAVAVHPDPARRVELMPLLAEALFDMGDYRQAETTIDEAIALADAAAMSGAAARARLLLCFVHRHVDPVRWYTEVERTADAAGKILSELGDERGLARRSRLLGIASWDQLQLARAEAHQRDAIERARSAGDAFELRQSLILVAYSYANGPKPVSAAEQELLRLEELGGGSLLVEGAVLEAQSVLATVAGRVDEARVLRDRGIAIYEDLGLRGRAVLPRFRGAHWDIVAGNLDEAEQAARRAADELEAMGELGWRSTAVAVLGLALAELGRFDEALSCADESRRLGSPDDVVNEIWIRFAQTAALGGLGRVAEAERVARETVAITTPTDAVLFHAEALTWLARALRLAGEDEQASAIVAEAVAVADRKQAPLVAARARAVIR